MASKETKVKLDALQVEIQKLAQGAPEFGAKSLEYVNLLSAYNQEFKAENASGINLAKSELAKGIHALVGNSPLANLTGEPTLRVVWEYTPQDGETPAMLTVAVNPKRVTRAPKSDSASSRGNGNGKDLIAIFEAHATPEERAKLVEAETKFADDAKKRNSATWLVKNHVAKRLEREGVEVS